MIALLLGYGLMGLARSLHLDLDPPRIEWASAWWLFPYLVGLSVVSYLGDFGSGGILGGVGPFKDVLVGGRGVIPLWWDMACLAVLSLADLCRRHGPGRQGWLPGAPDQRIGPWPRFQATGLASAVEGR